MDWADKIVANKIKRGDNSCTAESLRLAVQQFCDFRKPTNLKKELKRLIKLKVEEDKREQFQYDYTQKGIIIETDYHELKIGSVQLPFTAEEWMDLLNKDGEYLPSCCANISRIRDILQRACRNDYYIEVEDFYEVYCLATDHNFKIDEEPIGRMITLWNKIKDDVRTRSTARSFNYTNPEDAIHLLAESAGHYTWHNMQKHNFEDGFNKNYALATIKTAVHTLFYKLKELTGTTSKGFGLVRDDGEVGKTRNGLAVFKTKKLAQEVCDRWNKEGTNKFTVKEITVNMDDGLVIN